MNPKLRAALVTLQDSYGKRAVLEALAVIAEEKRGLLARGWQWRGWLAGGRARTAEAATRWTIRCMICPTWNAPSASGWR